MNAGRGPAADVWSVTSRWGTAPGTVQVDAAGSPITVSCDTAALADVPEAWGTALCLPAARAGATLRLPSPVDARWRAGAAANVATTSAWWGGQAHLTVEAVGSSEGGSATKRAPSWRRPGAGPLRRPRSRGSRPAPGLALCFTLGADSFFSLLVGDHRPTHLLYVVGFDVDPEDERRVAQVIATVHAVANEVGAEALIVRTDLRSHPQFASVSWEHTHGAALAAIGHLLHPTIGTLVIPPSYASTRLVPWGSRPDLDARWSVPGRLAVEHGDTSGRRVDRVLAIAADPLVHRHLRVCWRNADGLVNCGRCEKCVRTMVMLAGADQLQHCTTFPDRAALPALLDALPALDPRHHRMWTDLVDLPIRPDERHAVEALLGRHEVRDTTLGS